ncbi:hypothetical protein [Umezawaea sp.]|uniref:hypothetical protein n=1 Tax=Umezawaea sp. TaxID=1955258 RepID=UPI002ED34363
MARIVKVLLGVVLVLGGVLGTASAASAAPGDCSSAGWVLRSGQVTNTSTGARVGVVATYANSCDQYWAQVKLDKALGEGQWANAFVDVYVDGVLAGRLTCASADGGNAEVSKGQTSCYTGYFTTYSYGVTFQSHAYAYNYPSRLFASGITAQRCSRLMCDN